MKITNACIALVSLFLILPAMAQEKKTVSSKITDATVFYRGAELTHTATATLKSGENEITVQGLSPDIDLSSIKIKTTGNVLVSSFEYTLDYLSSSTVESQKARRLKDSIDIKTSELEHLDVDIRINTQQKKYLETGIAKNVSGSEEGLGIDDLVKTMEYFQSESRRIDYQTIRLAAKREQLQETLGRLNSQYIQETRTNRITTGVLKINVSSPSAVGTTFTITYYTNSAGWKPAYDINIKSTVDPVVFNTKARVFQSTGMDWDRVRLTLSTATPGDGKTAPLFSPWILQEQRPSSPVRSMGAMVQNSYSYMKSDMAYEDVMYEKVAESSRSNRRSQSAEPIVIIDGVEYSKEYLDMIDPAYIKEINVLKDDNAAIYGSRGSGGVIVVTLKDTIDDYLVEKDNELSIEYAIELPYTIPGNGKIQNIDLGRREARAEYKYYTAPKLDPETYVLAEIPEWEKLGLLTGPANITFDGTYIGETIIDASSTQPKLAITLGTDKRVAVKRERVSEFTSSRNLGSDTQQTFTYRITVKNNQTVPIDIVVKDQYPVSSQRNIDVQLRKETTPWTANVEELGVVTWEETLSAGQTKTYELSYIVRYPKGMRLNF